MSSTPDISVVVLSSSGSNEDVTRAIYLGAMGFVPKRASNQVLFGALEVVPVVATLGFCGFAAGWPAVWVWPRGFFPR